MGGIITTFGLNAMVTAKKVKDLENDMDISTHTFKSYDKGDKFILTGRIMTVIETKYIFNEDQNVTDKFLIENFGGKYIYILDKKVEVYSDEKIGNIGDTVYIECKIEEIKKSERMEEILKVNPSINLILISTLGIVFLIISFINIFLVFRKKKAIQKAGSQPYKIARLYEDIDEEDEETFLYKFLKTKDNNPRSTLNQFNKTIPTYQGAYENIANIPIAKSDTDCFSTETVSQSSIHNSQLSIPQANQNNRYGSPTVATLKTPTIRKVTPIAATVPYNEDLRATSQAGPVQSCYTKIKQKQVLTPLRAQPNVVSRPAAAAQPSITHNIQSVSTNIESSTQKLKTSADKLKILTEKIQVPIAKPAARADTSTPNNPALAKLIKVKVPTAIFVQPNTGSVPPVKKPIMAKPVTNQEIKNSNKILNLYKDIESEDDELALYKSLHSINDTNN